MAKCRTFSFKRDLREVVADGLYMQAVVGEDMSVGVVKFVEAEGAAIPAKSHAHGEEVTLQVQGGCAVLLGVEINDEDPRVELEAGSIMIMPAEQSHYGVNRFDQDGVCLRLNVVSPPRKEYGAKGREQVYYPVQDGSR